MLEDITQKLIGLIQTASEPGAGYAGARADIHDDSADLLSNLASWEQIVGAFANPVAVQQSGAQIGFIAGQVNAAQVQVGSTTAAAQAVALTTVTEESGPQMALVTAQYAIAGSVITLGIALVLTILSAVSGGDSTQTEQMNELIAEYKYIIGLLGAVYWDELIGPNGNAALLWNAVAKDLDEVKNEGIVGEHVKMDQPGYFDDVDQYVIQLSSGMGWQAYWQAPAPPSAFEPPLTWPTDELIGPKYSLWYGDWPTPAPADPSGDNVMDPATFLPFLVLGLNAWFSLNSMGSIINPATETMTLTDYVATYNGDLTGYLTLIYQNYAQAVLGTVPGDSSAPQWGIVKADQPSAAGLQWFAQDPPWQPTWDGPWNGVYGAVATYPSYATHLAWPDYPYWPGNFQQPDVLQVCAPSYFISRIDPRFHGIKQSGSGEYWIAPYLQNKVMLGAMARWKAIYLISGYDRIWQTIQAMQSMLQPDPPIAPDALYLPDGTKADGNWSVKELCTVLKMGPVHHDPPGTPPAKRYPGPFLNVDGGFKVTRNGATGYSVQRLLQFLDLLSGSVAAAAAASHQAAELPRHHAVGRRRQPGVTEESTRPARPSQVFAARPRARPRRSG